MARIIERLSEQEIREAFQPGLYADGGGLYLQVKHNRARSWIFRYSLNGRTRDAGLGSAQVVTLADARAKASEYRLLRDRGVDPIELAREARSPIASQTPPAPKFRDVAEEYIKLNAPHWKCASSARAWRGTLERFAYPTIGDLPIDAIETPDILKVLEPIWTTRCETAQRLRGRIERILGSAAARGLRKGNPAVWRGHLKEVLPGRWRIDPVVHLRAMPFAQLPEFIARLRKEMRTAARALEFLILTATRTSETLGAKRSEIDYSARLWTIPKERMKTGREHVIPLSTRSMEIAGEMTALGDVSPYLFPSYHRRGHLSQNSMIQMLQRDLRYPFTVHGFRSSFRDWCGDVAGAPRELAETALAHVVGDATERAYRRGTAIERRRGLMQQWCDFCNGNQEEKVDGTKSKQAES